VHLERAELQGCAVFFRNHIVNTDEPAEKPRRPAGGNQQTHKILSAPFPISALRTINI
jgi:hypothetical protein